jgi:hypothetical protein
MGWHGGVYDALGASSKAADFDTCSGGGQRPRRSITRVQARQTPRTDSRDIADSINGEIS